MNRFPITILILLLSKLRCNDFLLGDDCREGSSSEAHCRRLEISEVETERVWVHTCSLGHPSALKNYQARGFTIYKTEVS